jgi:hypothetical protein
LASHTNGRFRWSFGWLFHYVPSVSRSITPIWGIMALMDKKISFLATEFMPTLETREIPVEEFLLREKVVKLILKDIEKLKYELKFKPTHRMTSWFFILSSLFGRMSLSVYQGDEHKFKAHLIRLAAIVIMTFEDTELLRVRK